MLIESLGPWGQPQHGVQGAYDQPGAEALAYQCAVSIGYSVIPAPPRPGRQAVKRGPDLYYRLVANKAPSTLNLWTTSPGQKQARLDRVADPIVRRANLDYRAVRELMHTRTLLPGDAGVLWEAARDRRRVLFSYKQQAVPLPAGTRVLDQSTGARSLVGPRGLAAEAFHTYVLG
jgi:hypothetical protein